MATRYQLHVADWIDCTRCELYETRTRVVLTKGRIPCDVLFVGEAPGKSEDLIGEPFVGPAGHLLDHVIERAGLTSGAFPTGQGDAVAKLRLAFTNLVACVPLDPADLNKTDQPPDEAVEACSPRLRELVDIAKPRLLVCVGKLPWDWLDTGYKHHIRLPGGGPPRVQIQHPAAILRANVVQKGLLVQRAVVTLRNAVEDVLCQ